MTREEAIENLKILKEDYWDDDGYGHETKQYDDTMFALDMVIKALEQEQSFKWCTGCKEFDQENHCCHRWSKVIRDSVEEIKQEQGPILDKIFCMVHPLSIMSTPELEHKAIMQIAEMLEPLCLPESEAEDGECK